MVDLYTTKSPNLFRIYVLSGAYLLHFTAFLAYATFIMPYLLNPPFSWEPSRIGLLGSGEWFLEYNLNTSAVEP